MATQETIKQLFSGGVLRDIEDADARQAITALQNALDALTSGDTTTAIENFQEVIDFLEGVTDDETLIGKITALQTAINGKQPMLTFDNAPTAGSNNPVKSGGVKTALDAKVNTETGKGLSSNDYTDADKAAVGTIASKANDNVVVKSISVNGQAPQTPTEGNVNISVEGTAGEQEISILFVGNSLTQDAVSYLPLVLKEITPRLKFNIYIWYDGGYTLTQILDKWNNNTAAEIFSVCENVTSWTNANNTQKMGAFLASGKTFDVVCLEEYFNYKRESGYTAADKQSFNDIIAYLRTNYNKPFKVVSFFHRPLCKDTNNQPDLAIADEVFGLTYDGVRWQLENTISEGVIPSGIAAYRAMYESSLTELGQFGYMSYDGTHSQEGLPCLMQAWVCALWLLDKLGIEISVNNAQTRVTSANWSSINVPGPNPSSGTCVVGTTAQDRAAMDVAIKAYKEGKRLEAESISPFGVPAYKVIISGGSGTQVERTTQLGVSFLPADASDEIVWSVVSGDATASGNGLVTYNGSALTATVVVQAKVKGKNLAAQVTLSYALANVETPTFNPAAGTYNAAQSVAISCATAGASIYYTTDGSTPTSASTPYTSPIAVNESMTIKAIAILNGDSSNVATASYVVEIPHTVTVSVDDGTDPIADAVVLMSSAGTDIQPTSSSNGVYVFSVIDGTYTLSVVKSGYDTHTEQIVVNGADVTKSVSLNVTTTVDLLEHAEFFNNWNSYLDSGQYSCFAYNGRATVLVPNDFVSNPITWNARYPKEGYSPVEIPSGVHSVDIRFTNTAYKLFIYIGKNNGNSGNGLFKYTLKAGEPFRLVMANYSEANNIVISVRRVGDDDSNFTGTSISDLGLTCVANLIAPADIIYDMTPNLTLLNGIVTSNREISTNAKRASMTAEKQPANVQYSNFTTGTSLSQEGATYAKPTIPFGTKQVRVHMTNSSYKVAWFRLYTTSSGDVTTIDNSVQLAWSVGRNDPYTLNLTFLNQFALFFQCNIADGNDGDVNTSIAELGMKVEFVL